jgi:hypothetical protein
VILTNVFSRMWSLPEADEVAVLPNLRREEEAERKTGDCNVGKVMHFLANYQYLKPCYHVAQLS